MSDKTFKALRLVQVILPDILFLYSVLDTAFGWGSMNVATKIVSAIASILGHLLKFNSDEYFSTRSIVTKIVPDIVTDIVTDNEVE